MARYEEAYPVFNEATRDLSTELSIASAAQCLNARGVRGGEMVALYMLHPGWPTNIMRDHGIGDEITNMARFLMDEAVPAPSVQNSLTRVAERTASLLFNAQLN